MWWEELRRVGKARTAEVEALEFWGMIRQNTTLILHLLFITPSSSTFQVYVPCQSSTSTQTELVSLSQYTVFMNLFFFFPLSYSRFLMQPCDYVKCCLSGLFVCLIAAECCVSCSSACILKQSQCGIIRHLTTLGADRPSSTATGNCSQLAWLSSNQRTWGPLYKHTQTNTPILTQINDLKLT